MPQINKITKLYPIGIFTKANKLQINLRLPYGKIATFCASQHQLIKSSKISIPFYILETRYCWDVLIAQAILHILIIARKFIPCKSTNVIYYTRWG